MAVVNGYATLAQVRSELGPYAVSDTGDDGKIELSIEAASRQIDTALGFRLWQDAQVVTREFYAESPTCVDLYEQPGMTPKAGISTLDDLEVKIDDDADGVFETTLTIGIDFIVWPPNSDDETQVCFTELRAVDTVSFPRPSNGRPGVQIAAKFGWSTVPDWAEKACIIQAIQLFKSKDAAFGIATFGDVGGGLRVRAGLNPFADALVRSHARAAIG